MPDPSLGPGGIEMHGRRDICQQIPEVFRHPFFGSVPRPDTSASAG